jgi:hypothetical protein
MMRMKTSRLDNVLCGVAGEYFVAAELSRRGYIASITLRNTRGVDILASNRDATKSVAIQVKTNQRGESEWILNEKIEREETRADIPENLFFVFVNLPPSGDPPSFHIASRREVARLARQGHETWLAQPGRSGRLHSVNNPIRKFKDLEGKYRDAWATLGLD